MAAKWKVVVMENVVVVRRLAVSCIVRLCEKSLGLGMREKATRTIDLYGVSIFPEGDSNLFFTLQNSFDRVFTRPLR